MARLSETQLHFLGRYVSAGQIGVERDGTYMPYQSEARTAKALANKGLIKWVHCGQDGYIYNGYAITPEGIAAHKSQVEVSK